MDRDALVAKLDSLLSSKDFADGQENGLQIEGREDVERVACAVSVNQHVIDEAVRWGADVLLTHHGLLWKNQPLHVRGIRRRRLRAMLSAELSLITYHLPLDAHPELGNNRALADVSGCVEAMPAFEMKGRTVGMVGQLVDPMAFGSWVIDFETALKSGCPVETGPFHAWPHGPREVQNIGFLSGAAPYQVQDAIDMGLDCYVTGEPTEGVYHLAKEAGIHFVAGGHYLTERLGVQRLGQWLEEHQGLETQFFDAATLV